MKFKKNAVAVVYVILCLLFLCFAAFYCFFSFLTLPLIKTPFAVQDDIVNENLLRLVESRLNKKEIIFVIV